MEHFEVYVEISSRYNHTDEQCFFHYEGTLERIFFHKRDGNVECRIFHNKKYCGLYHFPIIVRVIKYTRWTGHVAKIEVRAISTYGR